MKKFKINETTTLDEIENELERMCSANANEFELSIIIKIAEHLGCVYLGGKGGSAVRFSHPAIKTFKNIFSVHLIHGRKVELVYKVNFKQYIYPHLKVIIETKK